jgi:AcrR family transcriptional regulator
MRSVPTASDDGSPAGDRAARNRIRDAAIACFAEYGFSGTTVRLVAATAGVSPGLVIHHFGSMEKLRIECDDHVTSTIREVERTALSSGPPFAVFDVMRDRRIGSASRYLASVLTDRSPAVDQLVDDLVSDAEEYLEQGVASGILRPTDDPRGRAIVLVLWSLGGLVLHDHFERLLGVGLTDPDVADDPRFAAYLGPLAEILGRGIFAADFVEGSDDGAGSAEGAEGAGTDGIASDGVPSGD